MIFYIAAGGALGAVLRYCLTSWITFYWGNVFPYGTLLVNILGSLLLGIVIALLSSSVSFSLEWRAFLMIGVIGSFTTFSTFSMEIVMLCMDGQVIKAVFYSMISIIFSLLAVVIGLNGVRLISGGG